MFHRGFKPHAPHQIGVSWLACNAWIINEFENLISTHDFNFHPLCVRLMPFTKESASLHEKPAKHKLHLSAQSSLTSEIRHFDALTHNLHFCAYSGLQNTLKYIKLNCVFGSAHVKIGVWIKVDRSTAVIPGWARREERLSPSKLYQPFRIDSDAVLHMNLIHWIRFGSCEVRRLNRA